MYLYTYGNMSHNIYTDHMLWLVELTFLDIQDSNLVSNARYPYWGFLWFPWSLQANSRTVHIISPQSLPFICFPNRWTLIILPFDTTQSQLLLTSLNHKKQQEITFKLNIITVLFVKAQMSALSETCKEVTSSTIKQSTIVQNKHSLNTSQCTLTFLQCSFCCSTA
jgi:hypothetical protein